MAINHEQVLKIHQGRKAAEPIPAEEEVYTPPVYKEIETGLGHQVDVIQQLNANIHQIEDLCGRLSFMVREIKSVIPKR